MAYTAITVEGGLFPADLLDQIATGHAEGQRDADFDLPDGRRLTDEIQSAFSDARTQWDAFQSRLGYSRESRTTLTRANWVVPLLERLGYHDLAYQQASLSAGGAGYPISHLAGDEEGAPPVHIVSIDQPLDKRGERSRLSPHALVQGYLNGSEALWGIVTDGATLRVLRDSQRLSRPTYLEFDLRAMMEGNLYNEFALFYRLVQRTRLPRDGASADRCLLETYYQLGIEGGGRVRERLREGVEAALREMGTAFLAHPESSALRDALTSGTLTAPDYYRQLLRLVYRLLFLMVVEDRRLLFAPATDADGPSLVERQAIYTRYYSLQRLRDRCERPFAGDRFSDLWEGLKATFTLFRDADAAAPLGLSALNGELFGGAACRDLEGAGCANESLLLAIRHLSTFRDEEKIRRRVNYAALDVEELGSIYESLLEFHPRVTVAEQVPVLHMGATAAPASRLTFDLAAGSERKQTGSYYTPPALVHELIESALVPVMQDRLAAATSPAEGAAALLSLRVVDPASGSGHFLLAAARRIARELAKVRSGEDEPAPEAYRAAMRDVVRNCVYAVDKNPLAVDLCKVALWIEGYNAGFPLSFLDNHIKWGDALVGVADLNVLPVIPDEAYAPVTGDDKAFASTLKKRNKQEQTQGTIFESQTPDLSAIARDFRQLGLAEERTPYEVKRKEQDYERLRAHGSQWWDLQRACDLWTSAFFSPVRRGDSAADEVPTTGTVRAYLSNPRAANQQQVARATEMALKHPFFHWPLEFPDVFAKGGFDVVLGNPPWERIKLQEEEFFASRDPEIARAANKAARGKLIAALVEGNPQLSTEFMAAKHEAEAESKFIRGSGRFPLCGRGDVNTYSIFAETNRTVINPNGRAGCIVPSGIATDDTTKLFFGDLMGSRSLVSLYDFENREAIFPGVHRSYKFCLLTLTGPAHPAAGAEFAFFLHRTEQLREAERRFVLTREDMALLNPNTRTCPIFRTRRDAEITKAIYRRVPVLIEEGSEDGNPWDLRFMAMFHMSNDSHLFRTREQLETGGWWLEGNVFVRGFPSPPNPLSPEGRGGAEIEEDLRNDGEASSVSALPNPADISSLRHPSPLGGEGPGVRGTPATYLPLYEAKMLHQFDHRWATYDGTEIRDMTPAEKDDPDCLALPRYWIPAEEVAKRLHGKWDRRWLLGFRRVCRSTDERSGIFTVLPRTGAGDSVFLILTSKENSRSRATQVSNLGSFAFDFVTRQKAGGINFNFFILKQLPVLPPSTYDEPTPWAPHLKLADWLAPRVLELTYTAWDLQPFARDLGYDGPPFPWDEERRFQLRGELDAAFFHLYGIDRDDVEYIMGTFPIVQRNDEKTYGEYRTRRVILEMYDAMQRAIETSMPYGISDTSAVATAARA